MKRIWRLLRIGFDRTAIYLPVIVAAGLALGTYWLVRNAPQLLEPRAPAAPEHKADAFMRDFVVKNFWPNGTLRSELHGKEGRHYPDTDTLEVDQARLRAVSEAGLVTNARARRGISNADGSEVQLLGDAVVVRDAATNAQGQRVPRLEFQGDFLHLFTDTERVRSDQPVTLIRDDDRFTADAMDYDHLSGVLNLRGRVRGFIAPPTSATSSTPKPKP